MQVGRMYNPPHPGEVLKGLYLEELNITITQAAKDLGISRVALSEIVNGRRGISPEMAFRLAKALDTDPEMWMNMQKIYDLWKMEPRREAIQRQVRRIVPI